MQSASFWVLVANDDGAAICASQDGCSQLVNAIKPNNVFATAAPEEARRYFAQDLMAELRRGASELKFGGVIIIAPPTLMKELRRVLVPEIRKLLVAEISNTPLEEFSIPSEQFTDALLQSIQ